MYQTKFQQLAFENFHLPFGGKLDPENRWMKLADAIALHVAKNLYAKNFPSKRGAPVLTVRMAPGSLIIKEKLGLSDMETVAQVKENPYLQYFIGLLQSGARLPLRDGLNSSVNPNWRSA